MDSPSSNSSFSPENTEYDDVAQVRARGRRESLSSFSDSDYSSSTEDDPPLPATSNAEERERKLTHYLPLLMAAMREDWESASKFLEQEPDAVRARISPPGETALIVAAGQLTRSVGVNHFVEKLVERMSAEDIAIADNWGSTALHRVAAAGNVEAARLLVSKNPNLPNVADNKRRTPLFVAALPANRQMFLYLLEVTREEIDPKPFEDEAGVALLYKLTMSGFYDIALTLLQHYPQLARLEPSPLVAIAVNHSSSFRSTTPLNFWQNLIYSGVPLDLEDDVFHHSRGDVENPTNHTISVNQSLRAVFWEIAGNFVPQINHIREQKLVHHQALQLVKCLCKEIAKSNFSVANRIFASAMFQAISTGIHEIVEEIMCSYPCARALMNQKGQNLFQYAIVCRCENVFNLRCQHDMYNSFLLSSWDKSKNNPLHLAGILAASQLHSLKAIAPNAALQMQRELQWFKEVENLVFPHAKEEKNLTGRTPSEEFTATHEELLEEAEGWMKITSICCAFVAALITTIVFAAAIAVPAALNTSKGGRPILSKQRAFTFFCISDVLALSSSVASLLTFLSILTCRCAEVDFLYALPKRLIIGLSTLFFSILSMMVAFGSTIYLVFGRENRWFPFLVVALASLPMMVFSALQLPLLVQMIRSTYGRGILGNQSERSLFYQKEHQN